MLPLKYKMPLTKKKMEKIQNYLALSGKHPEAWLAHGYMQQDQQNKLVSNCCLLQVTPEELIQRSLQYFHHLPDQLPWSPGMLLRATDFSGRKNLEQYPHLVLF